MSLGKIRVITAVLVFLRTGNGTGAACGLRRLREIFRAQLDRLASESQVEWCDRARGLYGGWVGFATPRGYFDPRPSIVE